jgi:hypothetical protein
MEYYAGPASNTPHGLNAKMVFKEYNDAEFEGVGVDTTGAFVPSFTKFKSHKYPNTDNDEEWCIAQDNHDKVFDMEVEITRHVNEIMASRNTFAEGFLRKHGSVIKQLYFTACSRFAPQLMMFNFDPRYVYITNQLVTTILQYCTSSCNM